MLPLSKLAPMILPALILSAGIAILQAHAIPFWQAMVGTWAGTGWSLLLELISLWLWFRPGRRWFRPMAWATTVLLLSGPLYQVSDPVLREVMNASHAPAFIERQIDDVELEIAEQERSLDRYQRLAQERLGWQPSIDHTEVALVDMRKKRDAQATALSKARQSAQLNWQRYGKTIGLLLSLAIFQAAIVLAITTLSTHYHRHPKSGKQVTVTKDRQELEIGNGKAVFNDRVRSLQAIIRSLQQDRGMSYANIQRDYDVSGKDISLLLNHFDHAENGRRVLGPRALDRIEQRLWDVQ